MAQISITILNDAKENVARVLVDDSPAVDHYGGMGVGDSSTLAISTQHDLQGTDTKYKNVAGTYQGSHKVRWQQAFTYANLTNHNLSELVICEDEDNHLNRSLLRATFDTIALLLGQSAIIMVEVTIS